MCDYSLQQVKSRPAQVADKLVTRDFGTGTRGFCSTTDPNTAVCVLPGTELAFDRPIDAGPTTPRYLTAIFRQVNKEIAHTHHDALELPGGQIVMLTAMRAGQLATVLQLPAQPKTKEEAEAQKRAAFVG